MLQTLWLEHSGPLGQQILKEVMGFDCSRLFPRLHKFIAWYSFFLLLMQVKNQAALAWVFIVDRRIEAPDVFDAIQTYRVKLALLTQQELFVSELAEGK